MTIIRPNDFITGDTTVDASSSKDVDTIALSRTHYSKWVVYLAATGKSRCLEVIAVERAGTATHSTFGIVGDSMSYAISVDSDGSNMTLNISNNELTEMSVKFKRLITN